MAQLWHFVLLPFWNRPQRRLRSAWRIAIFVVLYGLSQLVVYRMLRGGHDLPAFLVRELVAFGLSAALVAGCTFLLDRRGLAALGWVPSPAFWVDLLFGCMLGAVLISLVVAIEWSAGWLGPLPRPEGNLAVGLAQTLLLFMAAGAAEEVVFRSYFLRNVADSINHPRVGPRAALALGTVVSSVLFGLAHASNPNVTRVALLNIVVAGVFLASAYVLTGRLGLSVGLHVFWNFFQGSVFGLPVSGIDFGTSILSFRQAGPGLWTGGTFGIEGGLLGFLAMVVGTVACMAWVRWTEGSLRLATELVVSTPERAALESPAPDANEVLLPDPAPLANPGQGPNA